MIGHLVFIKPKAIFSSTIVQSTVIYDDINHDNEYDKNVY